MPEQTRITLRLNNDLYGNIRKDAESEMRSINKQIEFILNKYYIEKEQKENR